jgi:hypothetical protein
LEPLNNAIGQTMTQPPTQQVIQPASQPTTNSTIELNDIHLPEQINDYPIALGWWLLLALFIALIIFSLIKFFAHKKNNKSKKYALEQLNQTTPLKVKETMTLLKWAAMQYFPRQDIAALYGTGFKQYLIDALPNKHQASFNNLAQNSFTQLYQNDFSQTVDSQFNQAAVLWLTQALPPKKSSQKSVKKGASK